MNKLSLWTFAAMALVAEADARAANKADPPQPSSRTTRRVEGWTVLVDDRLLAPPHEALGAKALRVLEAKLSDIRAVMAEDRLARVQGVRIVLDLSCGKLGCMQYHPDAGWLKEHGYSTDLAKCVHIPEAKDLVSVRNVNEQPWVVLHELAHAYHDQVLDFDEARILRAWQRFKASGHGDKALLYNGKRVRHYALTDQKEFFAEMTEAYFGMNDFFPFNRAELLTAEPEIHELMRTIWGPVPGARPPTRRQPGSTTRPLDESAARNAAATLNAAHEPRARPAGG